MLKFSKSTYDEINLKIERFQKIYKENYELYQTISRADFHMSDGRDFLDLLLSKLNHMSTMYHDIKKQITTLSASFQLRFENELKNLDDCMTLVDHCLQNNHIKNNWVRLRIWLSGHFEEGRFVPDSIGKSICHAAAHGNGNVGHATLETPSGYISFWPSKDNPSPFHTLSSDKRDEGPDAVSDQLLDHQKIKRDPDHTFVFYGLDVNKMDAFSKEFVQKQTIYKLLSKHGNTVKSKLYTDDSQNNCITACLKILDVGGVDIYAPDGEQKFATSLTGIVTPAQFAKYLLDAKEKEKSLYPLVSKIKDPDEVEPKIFSPGTIIFNATTDYQAKYGNQLSYKKGEVLFFEKVVSDDYLYCRNQKDIYGLVLIQNLDLNLDKTEARNTPRISMPTSYSLAFNEALKDLTYQPLPGKTNHFFHAIGISIGQTEETVRNLYLRYLNEHLHEFRNIRAGTEEKFREYIEQVQRGEEWGDRIEIAILQNLIGNRPIVIIRPDEDPVIPDLSHCQQAPIFIYYNGYSHYDTFTVKNGADPKAILTKIQQCIKAGQSLVYEQFSTDDPAVDDPDQTNRNTQSSFAMSM